MADNNEDGSLDNEAYEKYANYRDHQAAFRQEISLILMKCQNLGRNQQAEAQDLLESVCAVWPAFKKNDAVLRELNADGKLDGKSYFVDKTAEVTRAIYDAARKILFRCVGEAPEFLNLSARTNEIDPTSSANVSLLDGQEDSQNGLHVAGGKSGKASEDLLLRYLQQVEGGSNFPIFPVVDSDYRVWRKKVRVWETNAPNITSEAKIEFLLKSVSKNLKALAILRRFDSSVGSNYKPMLEALDEQFYTARNTVFTHFWHIMTPCGGKKDVELFEEIYNRFAFEWKSFEAFCLELMEVDAQKNELEVLKFKMNAIVNALLFSLLDDKSASKILLHLKVSPDKIPEFDQVLDYMKVLFLNSSGKKCSERQQKQGNLSASCKKIEVKKRGEMCPMCDGDHMITKCSAFLAMKPFHRRKALLKKSLCFLCLYRNYKICKCAENASRKCRLCGGKHNDLLHLEEVNKPPKMQQKKVSSQAVAWPESAVGADEFSCGKFGSGELIAVLPTATVPCSSISGGKKVMARVLFDTGAEHPLVTYDLAKRLGLELIETHVKVFDFQGAEATPVKHMAEMVMSSLYEKFEINVSVFLCKSLGGVRKVPKSLRKVTKVPLADRSDKSIGGRIDAILPAGFLAKVKKNGLIRVSDDLILENTRFGYIALGSAPGSGISKRTTTRMVQFEKVCNEKPKNSQEKMCLENGNNSDRVVVEALKKFFDSESLESKNDDTLAEESFLAHFSRRENGQMVVGLPLIDGASLGESKKVCLYRTRRVLEQLSAPLRGKYVDMFYDLAKKGYIRPSSTVAKYYVSHLPVINEESLTHPLRIVFDSSQKSSNKKSLNDIQLKGKKLQNSLSMVMISSRIFEKMITADISKMYLSIGLIEEHIPYQHTFMPLRNGTLCDVEMPTVIFGNKSSPFLAIRAMHELANKEASRFPLASGLLKHQMYVDDVLFSMPKGDLPKKAVRELKELAESAQLKLRKWASNDKEALESISLEDRLEEIEKEIRGEESIGGAGVLGLIWSINSDELGIKRNKFRQLKENEQLTLRFALSQIATVYDASGLLSPIFLAGRLLIKEISGEVLGEKPVLKKRDKRLDLPVSGELKKKWESWSLNLDRVSNVRIKRWSGHIPGNKFSILAFGDASLDGTGSTIYAHSESKTEVFTCLLAAKSNIKPSGVEWTVPKLEMKAADKTVILAMEVKKSLEKILQMAGTPNEILVYFFSDSEIVLAWLQGGKEDKTVYVQNRLKSINQQCPGAKFYYIDTKNNPADLASRKSAAADFIDNPLWWHGPEKFQEIGALEKLKVYECNSSVEEKISFQAKVKLAAYNKSGESLKEIVSVSEKISNWRKTIKRIGWLRRAVEAFKHQKPIGNELTLLEVEESKILIIKAYQQQEFANEVESLKKKKTISSGFLAGKGAFLDKNGILRNSSRLHNVKTVEWSQANPIVIPPLKMDPTVKVDEFDKVCPLTLKLIRHYHNEVVAHGGTEKVLTILNQEYVMPNAKRTVKAVIHRCVPCRIQKKQAEVQQTGNIPMENVTPSPPFYHVAMDAFGPIQIKHQLGVITRRNKDGESNAKAKAYGIIFTCRSTRGVHIEVAADASAEEFLRCFRNFVATRGLPRSVWSDSGTNFKKGGKICVSMTSQELMQQLKTACKSKDANAKAAKAINKFLKKEIEIESMKEAIDFIESRFNDQKVIFLRGKGDLIKFGLAPCYSPWFNGQAEAAVKVAKTHLTKICQSSVLKIYELHSVLKRVEAIMNSKPIAVHRPEDGSRAYVLTPAHFWASRPLVALPTDEPFDGRAIKLTKRIAQQDEMVDKCWEILREKHLAELQLQAKKLKEKQNIKVGQVVLLRDKNTGVNCWPKAIVVKILPGKDGIVRVVRVRNALGHEHERGVAEIVTLPLSIEIDANNGREANSEVDEIGARDCETILDKNKNAAPTASRVVRHSARLKSKFNLGSCLVYSISLLLIIFCNNILGQKSRGGALVYEMRRVSRVMGEVNVIINSDFNITADMEMLRQFGRQYEEQCIRNGGVVFKICYSNNREVQDKIQETINFLDQKYGNQMVLSRKRRRTSTQEGALQRFWKWLVGSSKTIQHSTAAVEHMSEAAVLNAKHLKDLEIDVNKQLEILSTAIDEHKKYKIQSTTETKSVLQLLSARNRIIHHAETVMDKYNVLKFNDDELGAVLRRINETHKPHMVPDAAITDFKKLLSFNTTINNQGLLVASIKIPIISDSKYEMLEVIAVPEGGEILDFRKSVIVSSHFDGVYTTKFEEQKVTENYSLIKASVWEKTNAEMHCAAAMVLELKSTKCVYEKLTDVYDNWYPTSATNIFMFVSNVDKELVCQKGKTKLSALAGIVTIEEGCYVETNRHRIPAVLTNEEVVQKVYHIPAIGEASFDITTEPGIKIHFSTRSYNDIIDEEQQIIKKTNEAEKAEQAVEDPEYPDYLLIVVASVGVTSLVIVCCLGYVVLKICSKSIPTQVEQHVEEIRMDTLNSLASRHTPRLGVRFAERQTPPRTKKLITDDL